MISGTQPGAIQRARAGSAVVGDGLVEQSAVTAAELDARFFRGLGDPTRVRILQLLLGGERSVGEIVEAVGGLQGRISSHLMCLRWCGYVTSRREGRRVYYSVTDPRVRDILRLAQSMRVEHAESLAACAVIEPVERDEPGQPGQPGQPGAPEA